VKRRILVEGSILDRGVSGSARVVSELQSALGNHQDVEVQVLRPNFGRTWLRHFRIGRAIHWMGWLLVGFPLAARPRQDDLLLSPIGFAPLLHRDRTWVILHDLSPLVPGAGYDLGFAALWRLFTFWTVALAKVRFVVISEEVERVLLERFKIPRSRVIRARWPVGQALRQMAMESCQPATGTSSHICVLMVGVTEPHKRFPLGVEAVRLARVASGLDIRLRLVGPKGRDEADVAYIGRDAMEEGWMERLVSVDDKRLGQLYRESEVLLVPSLTEGYCLPIIEAQANRCLIVHCRNRTLQDTAGGLSFEADPNPVALSEVLVGAILGRDAHAALLEAARRRALSFTWDEIVARL
jgi:hypothetical protein